MPFHSVFILLNDKINSTSEFGWKHDGK